MENISHTVIGLAVGEALHRILPKEKNEADNRLRRRLFLIASAVAGNFPDLDLVLTPLLPEPLGYLLHHRGHTHTLFYALPQALLAGAVLPLFWKKARSLLQSSKLALSGCLILLFGGFVLHLGLDFLNSYGIHPFHPFDSNWRFGDAVFIVEPFFWTVFAAPLLKEAQKKTALAIGVLLSLLILSFGYFGFLPWEASFLLILCGLFLYFLPRKFALKGGFVLFGVYVLALFWGSSKAKGVLARHYRPATLVDAAMSAYPANPFCWMYSAITLPSKNNGGFGHEYNVEKGALSLFPDFIEASACPRAFVTEGPVAKSSFVEVYSSKAYSLDYARKLFNNNCFFRAYARFARIPAIEHNRAWDARFQRGKIENNFSYIDFSAFTEAQCPGSIPQWGVPRRDILGPAANMH